MCGIAGIIKFDPSAAIDVDLLLRMRDMLIHRGPDGAGLTVHGHVGLAHRRLAIIDLAGGHQPMSNAAVDCWITYNGELYNFKSLRSRLQDLGCQFDSQSDTEVVLRAYEVFGEACVGLLDGMFAFAIWDSRRRKLFMARDRLGIKPLYYSVTDSELRFASEIKSLLIDAVHPHGFNRGVLSDFLANRYLAGSETFFRGIHKLLPGHTLSWSVDHGITTRRYWQPPAAREDATLETADYVAQIRTTLSQAVERHLVSDVPVGLFLSGGLDSTALGALMASMVEAPIETFSVGFSDVASNELPYARIAAQAIGSHHHELEVSSAQFFAALPHLIWYEDEPLAFSSSVPLHLLSKLASQSVKVVLSGEGADELFVGYDYRYRVTALNSRWGQRLHRVSSARGRAAIAQAVTQLPRAVRRFADRSFLALGTEPRDLFCENFSVFRAQHRLALLNGHHPDDADPHRHVLDYFSAAGDDIIQCMSHADLQTYLVELLMKQDQMSMSASIESRVPFLDNQLVDLVAGIPSRFKMPGWQTKVLLRSAIKDIVPAAILQRKKMGFPVPVSRWLRGEYWPLLEDMVLGPRAQSRGLFDMDFVYQLAHEHHRGFADHGERLWLLLNLEIWQRLFVDGESPADVYPNRLLSARAEKTAGAIFELYG